MDLLNLTNTLFVTIPRKVLLGEIKSSPTIPVEASTISHVGQHGNHQLYYYYIMG